MLYGECMYSIQLNSSPSLHPNTTTYSVGNPDKYNLNIKGQRDHGGHWHFQHPCFQIGLVWHWHTHTHKVIREILELSRNMPPPPMCQIVWHVYSNAKIRPNNVATFSRVLKPRAVAEIPKSVRLHWIQLQNIKQYGRHAKSKLRPS